MERKLVKQGRNALTVTLPAKWLQQRGLHPGDPVSVDELQNDLRISARKTTAKSSCQIHVRGQARSMICMQIIARYIEGHDVITVLHDNPAIVQDMAQDLIGMVIEDHTPSRSVIRSIIVVPEENFTVLLRRATHLFLQQARTLEELSRGKATLEDVKSVERLLDNNLLYCMRYLIKYERTQDAYRQFLICSTLELAADQVTNIAKHIKRRKALANVITRGIEGYVNCLFTDDLEKMWASLRAFRAKIDDKEFVDGLAYVLVEILYNYLGYVIERR